MSQISDLFVDVDTLPENGYGFIQLLFLGGVYAYLLMVCSNLISDGSELLLLVPSMAGMVGSIVLPVLGAVPDGCIVLFSGLGPDAQEQLTVGVGALAGSTIMLLTLPWFLSVMGGRVNIDAATGLARYKSPKLTPPDSQGLFSTGVAVSDLVHTQSYFVLVTSLTYLILQIPGLVYINDDDEQISEREYPFAMAGLIICLIFFCGYLYYQYIVSQQPESMQEKLREEFLAKAISDGQVTLLGIMAVELKRERSLQEQEGPPSVVGEESALLPSNGLKITQRFKKELSNVLRPFFKKYDENGDGTLSFDEAKLLMRDLGENFNNEKMRELYDKIDTDHSNSIEYNEFVDAIAVYIMEHEEKVAQSMSSEIEMTMQQAEEGKEGEKNVEDEGEEEEEEEEDIPDDFKDLSPEEQQTRIKLRSLWMMGLGTVVVLLVSDPMVDVLSELGARTGIPAFYVSFLLAPMASNASELIAAYNYAQKKTSSSISISMATLLGAAVMNNTFVLAIFMLLIVVKGLAWEYFAETLSILAVQLIMVVYSHKSTHNLFDAYCILMLYPLSLVLVYCLELIGWD